MSAKRNNISKITSYLNGKLDARDMHQLERAAQDDPFLMDALDGFEAADKDQQANIADLKDRLAARVAAKKEHNILLWRVLSAAACLLLLIGGYWLFIAKPTQPQYANIIPTIKHPSQTISDTKKSANPNEVKNRVDSADLLAKNNRVNNTISPQRSPEKSGEAGIDSNKIIAPKTTLTARVNGKTFFGGDVKSAIANIPQSLLEKAQIKDDVANNTATASKNKYGRSYGSLRSNNDSSAQKYLNTNLLSVNAGKANNTPLPAAAPNPNTGVPHTDQHFNAKNNLTAKLTHKEHISGDAQSTLKSKSNQFFGRATKNQYAFNNASIGKSKKDSSGLKYLDPKLVSLNTAKPLRDSSNDRLPSDAVIRGYIDRKIDPLNGASYLITGKEVQDNPVGNVEQLLQGKVAGLNIQNNTGARGLRGSVNIRGLSGTQKPAPADIAVPVDYHFITGKVTDTSGKPLAGVLIGNTHTNIATTDRNGRYSVKVNKDSALVASGVGYSPQNVRLNPGDSKVDFKLQDAPRQLAEVDIRGYVKRSREETTGASYIVTGPCKENLRFKARFFAKIAIAERYTSEHAGGQASTIRDRKFLRALKFIAKRAPTTIKADKTAFGFADLKTFAQNKANWLNWYAANKCNNLK